MNISERLLARTRPDGLFAANGHIAAGAIHALEEKGLRIPEDIMCSKRKWTV